LVCEWYPFIANTPRSCPEAVAGPPPAGPRGRSRAAMPSACATRQLAILERLLVMKG
jgi:hypothetical protein